MSGPRINTSLLPASLDTLKALVRAKRAMQATKDFEVDAKLRNFQRYVDQPVAFVQEALGGFLWSKQRDICNSVVKNRRTAVQSCHDVGKSAVAARIAAWWLACHKPGEAFVVTSAPTWRQVRNILWREITRLHKKAELPGRVNQTEWFIDDQIVAFGTSPADTDPTAFQGIHEKFVLVIFDEACGIAKLLWDAADTLVTNEFSRIVAIGNPDDPSTEFFTVCKPGSGWEVITISAFESPNFTNEPVPDFLRPLLISPVWVQEKQKKWGETSPLYSAKVLGLFPENADDGLISIKDLRAAVTRELPESLPVEVGVDVARYGNDKTVIIVRRGPVARVHKKYGKKSLMETVGWCVEAINETQCTRIKIDDSGVGGGVTDRLIEVKLEKVNEAEEALRVHPQDQAAIDKLRVWSRLEIVPVNVGEGPATSTTTERFQNLRAELHWMMRERFVEGDIDIEDDDDVLSQASGIRYRQNSKGKLQIESKDDMKKRGLPSPDDFDALVLAYATPAFPGSGFLAMIAEETAAAQKK